MLSRRLLPQLNSTLRSITRAASSAVPSKTASPSTPVQEPQAPNYPTTWSTNQRQRPSAGSDPRFEQTAMELQPNPLSAMELVANEPIRLVNGRRAVCDGGAYDPPPGGFPALRIFCSHSRWRAPWSPKDLYQFGTSSPLKLSKPNSHAHNRISPALAHAGTYSICSQLE